MKFADLHIHTIFSDGTYTPQELTEAAKKADLACVSVVDHDTVGALKPSLLAAGKFGIEVLPGIELSAEYSGSEVHILGYLIDYENEELLERLDFLRKNRIERVHKIVAKLKEMGQRIEPEDVFAFSGTGTAGRLHIARAMVKVGIVKSTSEAFYSYIGDKGPAYYCGFKMSPQEAISLIRKAGGVAVLAHPYTLDDDGLIPQFIEYGIMGLEVYYPEHTQSMVNFYLGLAKKYNLLITGGSDCHGNAKPEVKMGSVKIEYALVEKMKAAKEKL